MASTYLIQKATLRVLREAQTWVERDDLFRRTTARVAARLPPGSTDREREVSDRNFTFALDRLRGDLRVCARRDPYQRQLWRVMEGDVRKQAQTILSKAWGSIIALLLSPAERRELHDLKKEARQAEEARRAEKEPKPAVMERERTDAKLLHLQQLASANGIRIEIGESAGAEHAVYDIHDATDGARLTGYADLDYVAYFLNGANAYRLRGAGGKVVHMTTENQEETTRNLNAQAHRVGLAVELVQGGRNPLWRVLDPYRPDDRGSKCSRPDQVSHVLSGVRMELERRGELPEMEGDTK